MVTDDEVESGPEGFGRDVQRMASNFYSDNDIIASVRVARIQCAFYVLLEIFYQVVLGTNVGKTVNMACRTCSTIGITLWRPMASG